MFIFLFCENRILSPLGKEYYNKYIIYDEIGILICAIYFLITFILNKRIKNSILNCRTIITTLVLFAGITIRIYGFEGNTDTDAGKGDINDEENKHSKQFFLAIIRTLLLMISIAISGISVQNNQQI